MSRDTQGWDGGGGVGCDDGRGETGIGKDRRGEIEATSKSLKERQGTDIVRKTPECKNHTGRTDVTMTGSRIAPRTPSTERLGLSDCRRVTPKWVKRCGSSGVRGVKSGRTELKRSIVTDSVTQMNKSIKYTNSLHWRYPVIKPNKTSPDSTVYHPNVYL